MQKLVSIPLKARFQDLSEKYLAADQAAGWRIVSFAVGGEGHDYAVVLLERSAEKAAESNGASHGVAATRARPARKPATKPRTRGTTPA